MKKLSIVFGIALVALIAFFDFRSRREDDPTAAKGPATGNLAPPERLESNAITRDIRPPVAATRKNEDSEQEEVERVLGADAFDPKRLQAAREAFLGLIKSWESQHSTALKGTPGADEGGMIIMYLPPLDEATIASATRLLDEHGIPEDQRQRPFFEWAGLVGKHRYVSYVVNPADPAGARDTMWMAYMGNTDSIRIDPLTGALEMAPSKPGDTVRDLPLKYGMERYSHLFSFSNRNAKILE